MLKILSIKKIKTSLLGCNRYTKYHIYFMYIILWAWIYAYTHKTITTIKVINISVTTKSFLGTCLVVRMLCYAKSIQSCPTPCDPIDGSLPGCAVPGIPQARTVEWVAIYVSNAWKRRVKEYLTLNLYSEKFLSAQCSVLNSRHVIQHISITYLSYITKTLYSF